ncbi:MAG: flagellar biosynthesis anti-sigma factor FlgM [Dehalococcoidia bacterium]|nr:flagellar biosynthesis anti-sigma factor FlgM [Dehalococcoidia bacterium]
MNKHKIGQKAVEAYTQRTQVISADKEPAQAAKDAKKSHLDEVSVSRSDREMQEAQSAVRNAPDVREDKVAAIKKQIDAGTYTVPVEAVVEKLLSVFSG